MIAKRLKKGGLIGICSPSHIAKREDYARCIAGLEKMGYRVLEADNLYSETYGYGATPEERAADFNRLAANPEVAMIFFGGGEGGNELLPLIDFDLLRAHPKRVCSYSDGTTILEAIWAKTGLEVYYGQSPGMAADYSEYDASQFLTVAAEGTAERFVSNSEWTVLTPGRARGVLTGGYARNFALLLGTEYYPVAPGEKHVLFIEDHEMFGGEAYVSAMLFAHRAAAVHAKRDGSALRPLFRAGTAEPFGAASPPWGTVGHSRRCLRRFRPWKEPRRAARWPRGRAGYGREDDSLPLGCI